MTGPLIKDTNHFVTTYQGLHRPHGPDLVRQQCTQDALTDFLKLCESYTANCPGRASRCGASRYALPGRMVRKKTYKWTPLFDDWHEKLVDFNGFRYTFKTKRCPPYLMLPPAPW